jgi:hypothetical protein
MWYALDFVCSYLLLKFAFFQGLFTEVLTDIMMFIPFILSVICIAT